MFNVFRFLNIQLLLVAFGVFSLFMTDVRLYFENFTIVLAYVVSIPPVIMFACPMEVYELLPGSGSCYLIGFRIDLVM